ncbi:hypothetical protein [Onishia niordana]|uniref:hypothetical protein n=1 Tax=Onishia niordana TaxID=2508711 RepID=UPI003F6DBD76
MSCLSLSHPSPARRRPWRHLLAGGLLMLLSACFALPQTGLFAMRLAVTSLGIEKVSIGPYEIDAGLDTRDIGSLVASSLGMGSLPLKATMALGLGLPAGLPAVQMAGFNWTLDMPGLDAISGRYDEDVTLRSGDEADLRLPLAFDLLEADKSQLDPLVALAQQMASTGNLPAGSEFTITPGSLSGLGMTLPGGLLMPKLELDVGESGTLIPQGRAG